MNQTFQSSCFLSARHVILVPGYRVYRLALSWSFGEACRLSSKQFREFLLCRAECQLSLLDVHVPVRPSFVSFQSGQLSSFSHDDGDQSGGRVRSGHVCPRVLSEGPGSRRKSTFLLVLGILRVSVPARLPHTQKKNLLQSPSGQLSIFDGQTSVRSDISSRRREMGSEGCQSIMGSVFPELSSGFRT